MPQIDELLRSVDERPTVAAYSQAARALRPLRTGLRQARIALLPTFTIDSLVPYLEVEAARQGFGADVYVGPFNSVQQELLDAQSGCATHAPQVVFVAQLLGDVCPPLADDFLALSAARVEELIADTVAGLRSALQAFRRTSSSAVVLHNFALPAYAALGIYEASARTSQSEAVRQLNAQLATMAREMPGVYVLDFDRFSAEIGYRNCGDTKMWYLGRAPLAASAMPALARLQALFLRAILGVQRKCLVLDLDNTLWGGVVGEEGLSGIKLGHTYPGSVFCDIQRAALALQRRGVLLAVNSKNNSADVEEVFRSHPDMVLSPEHFACTRINWRAKPDNMLEIADALNIGLDSLVFLDDSPAERDLMRRSLPQVLTLASEDVKAVLDPLKLLRTLRETTAFDKLSFTGEDRRRGEMYQQQAARQQLEHSAASLDDFLNGLEMTVAITPVDEFTLPRVADLVQKTNQFNLTTRRHTAAELSERMADPSWGLFALRLSDRFGDSGVVATAMLKLHGAAASIDTFLMSCRVIGRTVETALLAFLADWARGHGATVLDGEFMPTAKNAPAAEFYAQHGFVQVLHESHGDASHWRLSLEDAAVSWPRHICLAPEKKVSV